MSNALLALKKKPWAKLALIIVSAVLVLAVVVIVAKLIRLNPAVMAFIDRYPGAPALPQGAPEGIPAWLGWQHYLNIFFMVLIIRTGLLVRTTTKPEAYWTRNNKGLIRTKNAPTKISLNLWLHLSVDVLWLLNGVVFVVLLFISGQWMRIVPTSWDAFPHTLSVAIQYASLDWPTENGWIHYNSLQVFAYFITVFIAAPLAAISGFRMSPAWSKDWQKLSKIYPMEAARKIHFPVMLYFVAFIIVHVVLVFSTGAIRNLNHMFASRDEVSWVGFWFFAGGMVLVILAWFATRTIFMRPLASLTGKVSR